MSLLKKLTPINLLEEKEKFFADTSYNPQFIYEENIDETELYKYGLPKKDILEKAKRVVAAAYASGKTESDLVALDGPIISQQKVTDMVQAFLRAHDLEDRFNISWSSSYISRATITSDTIKLKTSSEFRHYDTIGMIYHEIGTHALRRINYEQQPWYKNKKKYGLLADYLPTEEGLASIHSLLPKENKSAYSVALRYIAVDFAQHHSFSELWDFLTPYIDELEKRWMICVRQKRGMTDTSKYGGFTKDIVYFSGMLEVIDWLINNSNDLKYLYSGKICIKNVKKVKLLLEKSDEIVIKLPLFINDLKKYFELIDQIRKENNL